MGGDMVRASLLGLRRIERGRQTVIGNQQCHVCGRAWLSCNHIRKDRRCDVRALLARRADLARCCETRRRRLRAVGSGDLVVSKIETHVCAVCNRLRRLPGNPTAALTPPRPVGCGSRSAGRTRMASTSALGPAWPSTPTGRPASSGTRARRSGARRRRPRSSSYGDPRTDAPPTGQPTSSPPSSLSLPIIPPGRPSQGDGARPAQSRPGWRCLADRGTEELRA